MNHLSKHHKPDELLELNSRLIEKIKHYSQSAGTHSTPIKKLSVMVCTKANVLENCFYEPIIGFVVQGKKELLVKNECLQYGELDSLVVGVDMPNLNRTVIASEEKPFLAVSVRMDRHLAAQLSGEMPAHPKHTVPACKAMAVASVEAELLSAVVRLVDLLDKPEQAHVLAPMLIREIHYRTLIGPLGEKMRAFCTFGSQSNQIAQVITWLRDNYSRPVAIDDLARLAHMGTSTFHRHFKEVTALSPLQFQKKLRLHEARRLMLTGVEDAGSASLAVGYESQTQFNREYKRLFGEPPHRNISRLRERNEVTATGREPSKTAAPLESPTWPSVSSKETGLQWLTCHHNKGRLTIF